MSVSIRCVFTLLNDFVVLGIGEYLMKVLRIVEWLIVMYVLRLPGLMTGCIYAPSP